MSAPDSSSDAASSVPSAAQRANVEPLGATAEPRRPNSRSQMVAAVAVAVALVALFLSWQAQRRVVSVEAELVKRQSDAAEQAAEARLLAKSADEAARDVSARLSVLDTRVSESLLQRTQLENLLQSLDRSRDENVLSDVDAALRLAGQQSALTGSAEALVMALQQADERLARFKQPRLERVRRAVLQDLDRIRAASTVDIPTLALRLDDLVRQVDEWPLLATLDRRGAATREAPPPESSSPTATTPMKPPSPDDSGWWSAGRRWVEAHLADAAQQIWTDVRGLVRVTRVDQPEAALLAPDQAYFLRENLKLRLLNARLALFSRQFDSARSDMLLAQGALETYFDRNSRRVMAALEQLRQAQRQVTKVEPPRAEATLAVLAAVLAGR
jgi:uroporphyrin-III C-methyltransferase